MHRIGRSRNRVLGALVASILGGAATAEPLPVARETVRERVAATNNREWTAAFDFEASGSSATIYLAVQLIPAAGVTQAEIDRVARVWEQDVERIWSDRAALAVDGRDLPIRLDLSFRSPSYHHRVVVRRSPASVDQLNWSLLGTAQVVAHEVGHMLGAYDEYQGGGNDPEGAVFDRTSVMTSKPVSGGVHLRHFERVRQQAARRMAHGAIALVEIGGHEGQRQ